MPRARSSVNVRSQGAEMPPSSLPVAPAPASPRPVGGERRSYGESPSDAQQSKMNPAKPYTLTSRWTLAVRS